MGFLLFVAKKEEQDVFNRIKQVPCRGCAKQ